MARTTLLPQRGHDRLLWTYTQPDGSPRELVARSAAAGSMLVLDLDPQDGETRLLAHLDPDEPEENATAVCREYLASAPARRRCRKLEASDTRSLPPERPQAPIESAPLAAAVMLGGACFQLQERRARMRIPELRWTRRLARGGEEEATTVSLRGAIGTAESYEPFRALTRGALAEFGDDASLSTITLRTELERVGASAIVLNRALREAVVRTVAAGDASMSEIAMRCGRIKRDGRGRASGETSWLARRVGLLAEGGQSGKTPWVHSEVLGLIARRGLGISPREVELG